MEIGRGGFIYPLKQEENNKSKTLNLAGYGGTISILDFPIPQECGSFSDFATQMEKMESDFAKKIGINP
jgi:hypothetical protein